MYDESRTKWFLAFILNHSFRKYVCLEWVRAC